MQDNQDSGYFSQEELDAIVSGTVTPKMPVDLGTPQEQSTEKPIWDTADVALSVPRGVVGFGKSIYNLADTVSFDLLPDWHTNPLGSSQSHVGGLVEGLSQFVSGFATGGLALRGASMIPGAVGKAAAWLGGTGGGAAAVVRGGMVKGGIADFISFEGAEGRLSDILVEFDNPVLNNTVTQYLASDMDDSELEGRLKNVLEGAVLGVALEGIVAGVKGSAKAIRKYRQAKAAGVPEEDAVRAAMEVAGDDLEQASRMLEEPEAKVEFNDVSMAQGSGQPTPDRKTVVAEAKRLGLPATGTTQAIQRRVDILTKDPRTWTKDEFDSIKEYLAIHQDLHPGGAERAESIMRDGLRSGMVDWVGAMEGGRWNWSKGLLGGEAYIFSGGNLKFEARDNPNLAPGNRPLFKITTKKGQSIYDAIKESAVVNRDVNSLSMPGSADSATRFDRGVDAGAEMEAAFNVEESNARGIGVPDYRVKRGGGAIIDRINREASMGRLDRTDANFMVGIVDRMGEDAFSRFGIRFKNLGDAAEGTFNFLTDIITVSTQATDATRTFVHEVWHSMTGRLDDKMIASVNKDFQKALRKFEKDHGLEKGSLKDGLTSKARKVIKEKNLEKSEWYRLTDLDEWVAENMTDATFARLDLEEDTKSVFGFLRYFTSNFLTEFKAKFGGDKYNKLAKDWLNKRYAKAPEVAQSIDRSASQRLGYMRDAEALDSGGRNFGVEETRGINVPTATAASVRELEDLINTGAGADVISARIEQLREQGIINLRPVIQSGTPGAYAEALVALRQVEANEGRFGPVARRTNAENTRAGMAQLQAAMESGGLNVPEVMKAIQDGVATIKDFNERLPFFLGLEAAFRYEAVQALRSGRGDTDEVMRAFTMVSGSTRKIKSYLGKNLQMVQAFGDMDVVRRSWESLDPKQRRVLMNQYADTLEMLVVDPQTGKEMAKVLTEGMVSKGGRIGAELFRNSILSGPKTLAVNIWSAVEALALPMERGLGRLGAGQRDQALREFGTLARYSSEAKDALTAFKTSFMEEGDSVALGRGNTQFGDLQPSRAIASRNFARLNSVDPATGGVRRTIAGLAVDFVGQIVNAPMRAMGSSDEFFTTMMARAEADVVLRRIVSQERKLPMTSSAVSLEVERLKKLLFVDGQLYTRRTVVERGMRLARDKHLPEAFRETLAKSVLAKMKDAAPTPAARKKITKNSQVVVDEVSRLFNQAVSNNKVKPASELRKSKDATVLIQSLDEAGRRARANPMFIPEVQRYVDQNWDAYADSDYMQAGLGKNLQQQTGQDYRLLQKASAEVERRVREATWKREYDDMAESSVLGTQLVGNIGKATASAVSHVPLLQLVVPFIRTPTNLLAFVTDRNPVGRAYSWWQAAKAGDKDAAAEAAGRLATGTVLYTTGIVLAANGMITGRGPKDPDLRKQLLASGWQPYSFRLGDTYLSYGRNDPISTFLGLVADTYEIAANTYDPTPEDQDALMKVATAVVGSVANNVTNKSYLRGIVTTLGALTGDEAEWQKLQRQYAGALVPNFLAQVDQVSLDPDIREVRSMMDAMRSRLPLFGETVDRLRNPLGEPIKGNETAYSIFLPGTASTRTKDPVKRELADSLISVGSPRSTLPGGIDLRSIKLKNGQSAYDRLQELTGQVKVGGKTVRDQLAALIQSPFYKDLPALGQDDISSPRVSLVRGYVGNYRKAAMQQLLKESPELARAVAHSRELKASMLR